MGQQPIVKTLAASVTEIGVFGTFRMINRHYFSHTKKNVLFIAFINFYNIKRCAILYECYLSDLQRIAIHILLFLITKAAQKIHS